MKRASARRAATPTSGPRSVPVPRWCATTGTSPPTSSAPSAPTADRGVGAALIMPYANVEAMNAHLEEISAEVAPGAHAMLVCDRAGWHQRGGKLRVPNNITPLPLPPYSPELNPMENVW